jgi:hypothetical protein
MLGHGRSSPSWPQDPTPAAAAAFRPDEADLGPVHYLATLFDAADQDVLRHFILVVALLLDPAAMLLLLAATSCTGLDGHRCIDALS